MKRVVVALLLWVGLVASMLATMLAQQGQTVTVALTAADVAALNVEASRPRPTRDTPTVLTPESIVRQVVADYLSELHRQRARQDAEAIASALRADPSKRAQVEALLGIKR